MLRKDDLKEMGLPIGTRNKILAYIHGERKGESRAENGFKVMELMMKSIVEISKSSQKRDNKENTSKDQSLQLISDMPTSLKTATKQITLPGVANTIYSPEQQHQASTTSLVLTKTDSSVQSVNTRETVSTTRSTTIVTTHLRR